MPTWQLNPVYFLNPDGTWTDSGFHADYRAELFEEFYPGFLIPMSWRDN